ncbi:methyltransferase, FxLD system [Streptomyces sp. MZ04]|uniref:methyltransferase, FxLD system n=1 Tax=Streptomyces sp. MZ04 TaxID=2559236 RepID=UPI001ADF85E8|nr:methyltransferase, FxLD system [Streptomyces sp. MZ04]
MGYTRTDWSEHYSDGHGFRRLGDEEKHLLAEYAAPAPDGGRALDIGCGTGELSVYLTSLGYTVDGVDFAEGALERARAEHAETPGVRWLCLDVENDDLEPLAEEGYGLITVRLAIAFLSNPTATLLRLAELLTADGRLVVITPTTAHTPAERRHIALDEGQLTVLTDPFDGAARYTADELAVLVLGKKARPGQAVERTHPPAPRAVFGAAAVVTDDQGRVLLGRRLGRTPAWELPAGRIEPGETAAAAAVRELGEETGLSARVGDAHVLAVLHDARESVTRVTAVVRISAHTGTVGRPEEQFLRWEWHRLHTLSAIGDLFAPTAAALNAVWPGILPEAPPVIAYRVAADEPAVPGEPAEAGRLRDAMAQTVVDGGWALSPAVQQALRAVPRHRFAPEAPLSTSYDGSDRAVVTRRDETGTAITSVSAAWLQADMIEHLGLAPGAAVFEAGSGGYNAALLAHVAGPDGRVVTADIDRWVTDRTRRFLAETGTGRVDVVERDGSLGAPAPLVPRGGFDASVITYNCWDIAPAWRQQLAEGGRLVLPLELGGYTRAITFERRGQVLHARHLTYCGFVRDQSQQARTIPVASLLDGELTLRFEHGTDTDTDGLEEALRGPRREVATGVLMGPNVFFGSLQLYAATTVPQGVTFGRLVAHTNAGVTNIAKDRDAPAIVDGPSLAYLTAVQIRDGEQPEDKQWEWFAYGFGNRGTQLAEHLVATVRAWDRHVRAEDNDQHVDPVLTVFPAGTPDDQLPAGDVLDKENCRLVVRWPGRDALLECPVEQRAADAVPEGV